MTRRHLPQEIVDHIVDLLRDDPETLKQCCLASKSWVSQVQPHLFHEIRFKWSESLEAWKGAFPDPANSPVYHARSLVVFSIDITAGDVGQFRSYYAVRLCVTPCQIDVRGLLCLPPRTDVAVTKLSSASVGGASVVSSKFVNVSILSSSCRDSTWTTI